MDPLCPLPVRVKGGKKTERIGGEDIRESVKEKEIIIILKLLIFRQLNEHKCKKKCNVWSEILQTADPLLKSLVRHSWRDVITLIYGTLIRRNKPYVVSY